MSGAHPDPSFLLQTVLVILRFPPEGVEGTLTPADESYIHQELDAAADFLWTNSNQSLKVNFAIIKVLQSMAESDYEGYTFTDANGNPVTEYAGKYDPAVHQSLLRRHLDPRQFAGVVMIYYLSNAPGTLFENTWEYFTDQISSPGLNPGFSSIVYQGIEFPLQGVVLHEYCHQLHHRFMLEAHNFVPMVDADFGSSYGMIDSDWMTLPDSSGLSKNAQNLGALLGITFQPGDDLTWLAAILKYYVGPSDRHHRHGTLHAVNYRWLEGRRPDDVVLGVFYEGELKTKYDFTHTDDVLVYLGGDNLTQINPDDSPGTFWFRATPGNSAVFATQMTYGRYVIEQISFQYEVAPVDYTFQVHLVYYDNYGVLKDERIDDGIYVLGRQQFAHNHKTITLAVPREVEDFRIVFEKGNLLSGVVANDDWVLLGNIVLKTSFAP
jgi:hypothetical protein